MNFINDVKLCITCNNCYNEKNKEQIIKLIEYDIKNELSELINEKEKIKKEIDELYEILQLFKKVIIKN
jgi:Fe-S-cluster-containing dehydrogenase component